ncbi:hypothetical protein [Microbacterium capsulatum]|uniref:DUF4190 domain-containing protein n=1 Tax=Microbacterium capsulatum TaxID=3041921 RepID=A0ABU0XGR3_9MICO|nr:hypothetical protein [Microbacterium sp. ASV81]MDQ4214306.1 hypothetical protein [Microbacterium sp. ASV81]
MTVSTGGTDPDRYTKLPTAPTPVRTESGPQLDHEGSAVEDTAWEPTVGTDAIPVDEPRLAPWALLSAIVALFASLFVGWGIPVALIAVVAATLSLRRPLESRTMSIWALVLGSVATLYSAGWLIWAAYRFGWFG